jgi:tetratricopeptide (TPR) repeat protein
MSDRPRKTTPGGIPAPIRATKSLSTSRMNFWAISLIGIGLATITWLVFGQTLGYEFINYDDPEYVVKNAPVTRGLTFDGIAWAFTHVHSCNWHPLTWISHMVDCQFWGLNPTGHHFSNVLLHTVAVILLFLVFREMTAALWRSAFVAAVFAIHPLHVESVAWIAERKDILSAIFFTLTVWAYVRYSRNPSFSRYALVTVFYVAGLLSKPMLVTLPFILFLLDYWPLNRTSEKSRGRPELKRLVLEKLPLLGLALASSVVTLLAQQTSMHPIEELSLARRLCNAVVSPVDYLGQMFWPTNLAVLYPWEAIRLGPSRTGLSFLLLAGISVAVLLLRKHRYLVTGWFWYLVMLVPVIGIVQVGLQARADRYTYLPQIGLYLVLAWTITDLLAARPKRHIILAAVAGIILTPLVVLARNQTSYWKDSITLWTHALACTTDNTVAEGNTGEAYHSLGKRQEAMYHFERALQIQPKQINVHSNLGVFYLEMGRFNDSLVHLEKAIEIEPKFADAHYNLGNTYLEMGRGNDAVTQYRKALDLNPNDTQALNNMAWILATWPDALTRDSGKAVELAERANSLTLGKSPIASATLGAAYAEAGRFPEALETAHRALQLALVEGNTSRADSIREQISLYESGAAFRDRRFQSTSR